MCGFLGYCSSDSKSADRFFDSLQLSSFRGPDQTGYWSDDFIQLGFNRLSILDVSERGIQPLLSPSGRYVIVFNGEIYNYKKLQKDYGIPDQALRSQADSEVLAHLVEKLPIEDFAKALNGMFAIAIYDREEKILVLMRDFAGIKPLFYGISDQNFVFASQFDQVFQYPGIQNNLQINPQGLQDYLALGYMQAPNTVFKNIFQCLPGQWIKVDKNFSLSKGNFSESDFKFEKGKLKEDSRETISHLDSILKDVVKDQLVADVPVGLFLSGGIDSPLITYYSSLLKNDLTAYTIGVADQRYDESRKAADFAKEWKIKHKILSFTEEELLRENENHFQSLPEPFGDYSSLPTYLITKLARQENTVMLSGDGGDELFWGYPRFLNTVNHFSWFDYPQTLRKVGSGLARKFGIRISYGVTAHIGIDNWVFDQQCHNNKDVLQNIFSDMAFTPETEALYSYTNGFSNKQELLQWLRWNEFYGHLQRVLVKVDRTSMGNSLEVRVPFLDKRILDFAWNIQPGLGIHHQEPKLLLKKLLQSKLSHSSIKNEKMGFSVPIREWLRGPLKKDLEQSVMDVDIFGKDFIQQDQIRKMVSDFIHLDRGNEWGIWIIYAMQKWAIRYQLVR